MLDHKTSNKARSKQLVLLKAVV